MLNDKNSFNHDNRNLSEVFRELQEMQKNPNSQANNYKKYEKEQKSKRKKELSSISHAQNIRDSFRQERRVKTNDLKLSQIIIGCGILIVGLAVFFPKSASFQESYAKEVEETSEVIPYELNRHRLNMQSIISENAGMDRVKEQVTEEREVEFETNYNNNPSLPTGEHAVTHARLQGTENGPVLTT